MLNVSEAWLMGYDVPMDAEHATPSQPAQKATIPPGFEPMPEMDMVPLVGRIACGTPITAEQNVERIVCVPSKWRSTFTLTCKGDSMEPRIHDGDLVAIRKQPEVENVINQQAAKGYRLHTITTANGGSKGLMGGDRIQATMVFEKVN